MTWGIIALLWPVAVALAYDSDQFHALWERLAAQHPPEKILIGFTAVVLLAIVWTGKRQVDRLHFTLSGREWVTTVLALMTVVGWISLGVIWAWIAKNPRARAVVDAVAPWVLGVVMLCRVLAAAWALREVVCRGFLARRTAALGLVVWLLIAALLMGLLVWSVPAALVPVCYVVFAVLFAMPMVRLISAPLVLDSNRHR
jgi:hypothetical protein